MTLDVHLSWGGGWFEAELRRLLPSRVHLTVGPDRAPSRSTAVLVAGRPSEEDLDACPSLRALVVPFAGLPEATRARMLRRPGVAVHNLHHNAAPTAELAVALLLAVARRVVPADRELRAGDWRRRYDETCRGVLLEGGRAVVVGYGAIGRRVGRALLALGMDVDAVARRGAGAADGGVRLHPSESLDEVLGGADALVLAVPLTPKTRRLLDGRRLALLPPHAVLVNVARGEVVDEDALYDALQAGRLGGAGLDVWWRYPSGEEERTSTPPSTRPFAGLENVVLSPHQGGHVEATERLRSIHLADLLASFLHGGPVPNRVDLEQGY